MKKLMLFYLQKKSLLSYDKGDFFEYFITNSSYFSFYSPKNHIVSAYQNNHCP